MEFEENKDNIIEKNDLTEEQSKEVGKYLRVLSDFERISDHARNIGEAVEEIEAKKINFSAPGMEELNVLERAVRDITELTIEAFVEGDTEKARRIDPLEEVIDDLCDALKTNHIARVARQECTLENGFVFNDILTDYERISDHCSNVAVDILEAGNFGAHQVQDDIGYRQNEEFLQQFSEYKEMYSLAG